MIYRECSEQALRTAIFTLAFLGTAACGSDESPRDIYADDPPATFDQNTYRYCMDRNPKWLRNIMDRVEAARPELPPASLRYERLDIHAGRNGSVIDESQKGITFLMTAPHDDDLEANLWVWGNIDPQSCALPMLTGKFATNRFDDGVEFDIP